MIFRYVVSYLTISQQQFSLLHGICKRPILFFDLKKRVSSEQRKRGEGPHNKKTTTMLELYNNLIPQSVKIINDSHKRRAKAYCITFVISRSQLLLARSAANFCQMECDLNENLEGSQKQHLGECASRE